MTRPVLFVVHDFLPQAVAGTELHVLRLARALMARRPVCIFHTFRAPALPQNRLEETSFDGIPVTRVVQNYPYRPLEQTLADPALERLFRHLLKRLEPSVVHFHHLAHLPLSLPLLARQAGAATVFTLHDYYLACPSGGQLAAHPDRGICVAPDPARCGPCHHRYGARAGRLEALGLRLGALPGVPADLPFRLFHRLPTGLKGWVKRLNPPPRPAPTGIVPAAAHRWQRVRQLFSEIDCFISPSRDLADRFVRWGLPVDRLVHLPNPGPGGFDCRPLPPPSPLRLLFLGTLAPHKGLDRVVEAAGRFAHDALELEVAGDPDTFPDYFSQVRRRAAPNVRFTGPCPPDRVGARLAAAHALVLGSRWPENAPLTVLEAQAAGRPVVAPRAGGIPEQVRDGVDGLLYDPDDPAALSAALARLVLEPDLLPLLRQGVRPPLTPEAHASRIEAVYAAALAARGLRP